MQGNSLDLFDPITASWFQRAIGSPTAVQEEAWPAIASGNHTLVSAPTGTGKTLSAFLVFIDRLKAKARVGSLPQELQLIYVSPLKSLAGDIRENLKRPLEGISDEEGNLESPSKPIPAELNVAIRTGDTPQKERLRMVKNPPHILITTPESLYLMLTSKTGQTILKTAKAIIIDELHALIDSKRGAHLMLSIARLDRLCQEPLQRIGLSATIEPLSRAAQYLTPDCVKIVAPKMQKAIQLKVTSPMPEIQGLKKEPVWMELARIVHEHCEGTRSVIAFVEGRAYAEKLAYHVNLIAGEGFARTHHGSLSKEQRFEVENALRNGDLRLLCATSSMELGIDVGDIDQVFQIGCPRSISSTLQRLGRAGHNPGRVSVMHIFPRTAEEGLYSGLTAEVVRNGGIEYSHPPRLCLDVLAQHLVSMATGEGYDVETVMNILARAYPFFEVTEEDVRGVLRMLAGDYEHERNIPVRPRILYDRIHDRVEGDPYSRMLAVSAGGTIPDKGTYSVKTESGVKLGELDEEFIFESRVGDRFLLGTFGWQISSIDKDTVIVTQSSIIGARMPFWHGEMKGRKLQTGIAFGKIFRSLSIAHEEDRLLEKLYQLGLNEAAAVNAKEYIERQLAVTGVLPDERTILIEHFRDETGNNQMMVHSVFGRQVNAPLAILVQELAKRLLNTNINLVDDDDGFLLFPYGECGIPEGLLQKLSPESAREILEAILPSTPIFNMTFRYNASNALMMGTRNSGRQPLWVQRMRSAEMLDSLLKYENHPLVRETKRECLEDYWDLQGVEYVLNGIRSGAIRIYEMHPVKPSPMTFLLRQQTEASMMYDYSPTPMGIHHSTEEALRRVQMITPAPDLLARVSERNRLPEDEKQLHTLLMIEGDLIAGELEVPIEWLEKLATQEQVKYIEPGLWIAAEQEKLYESALGKGNREDEKRIVLRLLRYRGAASEDQIAERYFWSTERTHDILTALVQQESLVESNGLYYHAELYERARRDTIKSRRNQIKTLPAERYASLITSRLRLNAPAGEQLDRTLKLMCNQTFTPDIWENVLLPARVNGYRPELLDTLLSKGELIWHMKPGEGLSFHLYDDIDWEADLSEICNELDENERILCEALHKRGASFLQRLGDVLGGISPYETMLKLVSKGLVCADSFMPVRQLQSMDKLEKASVRQRVNVRVKALTSGRFELSRPLRELPMEQQLERIFDRVILLCRETSSGLNWGKALETLRVWEYTGRVRRGYFIEGLSGIQFIRDKDFAGTMIELEQPSEELIWLSAVDPVQPWGKTLPHMQDRSFLNVVGSVVAFRAGVPIAVFERQGKILRIFDETYTKEAVKAFVSDYKRKRVYPTVNRVIVKQYPEGMEEVFRESGFIKEIQDYVLYR